MIGAAYWQGKDEGVGAAHMEEGAVATEELARKAYCVVKWEARPSAYVMLENAGSIRLTKVNAGGFCWMKVKTHIELMLDEHIDLMPYANTHAHAVRKNPALR